MRGQLHEIRLDALHLDRAESELLLNGHLHLGLTTDQLDRIHRYTGGWAAALRLIALSLDHGDTARRSARIEQFTHHNRHIFDLLADEVLNQQPPAVRDFLLTTSVLEDLNPALCDAVTGRDDSFATLDAIYRRGLFLRLTEPATNTYRYHDLFVDFLRRQARLEIPDRLADLHLRAAAHSDRPPCQVYHYLCAEAWESAVPLIAYHGRRLIEQGDRLSVAEWLAALPQAWRMHSGWLLYLQGVLAYHDGDLPGAGRLLARAEDRFRAEGDSEGIFEAIMMQNAADEYGEDLETQLRYVERAQPHITTRAQQLVIDLLLAWAYNFSGKRAQASQHFWDVLRLVETMPEKLGFVGYQLGATMILSFDDLPALEARLKHILHRFDLETHVFAAVSRGVFAHIALWQGDIERALAELGASEAAWQRLGGASQMHQDILDHTRLMIACVQNDTATIDRLTHHAEDDPDTDLYRAFVRALRAWHAGDPERTRCILERMPPPEAMPGSAVGMVYRTSLEALLALEAGTFEQAEPALLRCIQRQADSHVYFSLFAHDLRVTLGCCYCQLGLTDEALRTTRALLKPYAERDIPGRLAHEGELLIPLLELALTHDLYPDFAGRVLALLRPGQAVRPIPVPMRGETLTVREVEVLRMIVDGASNRDIADACVIAVPTVKTHVTRIFQKLGVSSRTQAIARVHELGLL